MSGKNNIIPNIRIYTECHNNVFQNSIISNFSIIKKCNKKKKKKKLTLFIKFFIFIFIILILQGSNNLDCCKSWNSKNYLEKTLTSENKRFLAECKNVTDPKNEGSKRGTAEASVQLRMKQVNSGKNEENNEKEIEEKIDIESEKDTHRADKYENRNFKERILYMLKSNYRIISLSSVLLISFISCMLSVSSITSSNEDVYVSSVYLIIISLILTTVLLIFEEKKKNVETNNK